MAAKAKPKGMVGKHRWVVFGVVAVVAVLGYLWWRQRQSASAAPQPLDVSQAPWWSTEGSTGGASSSGDTAGNQPGIVGGGGNTGGGGGSGSSGGRSGGGTSTTTTTATDATYPQSPTYASSVLEQARSSLQPSPAQLNREMAILEYSRNRLASETAAARQRPLLASEASRFYSSSSTTPQPQYQSASEPAAVHHPGVQLGD